MRISRLLRPRSSGTVVFRKLAVKPAAAAARSVGLSLAAPDQKSGRTANVRRRLRGKPAPGICLHGCAWDLATGGEGSIGMRVAEMGVTGMGVTHVM